MAKQKTKFYIVTEAAKDLKEVAGIRNPGVDATFELTDEQAEHALRIGHIERVKKPASDDDVVETETASVGEAVEAEKEKAGAAAGKGSATGKLTTTKE